MVGDVKTKKTTRRLNQTYKICGKSIRMKLINLKLIMINSESRSIREINFKKHLKSSKKVKSCRVHSREKMLIDKKMILTVQSSKGMKVLILII